MKIDRTLETARNEVHRSAVTGSINVLSTDDRATVVMACGTGKTLVELGVAESLLSKGSGPRRILMQVPTLALIKQARDEWSEQQEFGSSYDSMCICSDQRIKGDDSFSLSADELAALGLSGGPDGPPPAEKEVARINAWLDAREADDPNAVSVIFTTYQSVKIVGQAMRESNRDFDLGVFDEAHKTAGVRGKENTFGYALQDANIPIKKRLFGTATPRVRVRGSDKDGHDPEFMSMDNPAIYGKKGYEISFREAAEKNIIVPYKVIISVINDDNIKPEHLDTVVHDSHNRKIDARTVANMAALERAMTQFDLKKAITFHTTIDAAEDFATVKHSIDGATLDGFSRLHVSGSQNSADRSRAMMEYADPQNRSIISNAKCLTEGINVTATDLVAFMDSKTSKVDIIQAIGRALRNHEGKEFGYVFLPLHVSRKQGETYEEAFTRSMSDFDQINDVLKALADSDEVLKDKLRALGKKQGKRLGKKKNEERLKDEDVIDTDKEGIKDPWNGISIEVLRDDYSGELDPDALVRAIETRIIQDNVESFDVMLGILEVYKDREGHCDVPRGYKEGKVNLGNWLGNQRTKYNNSKLSPERITQLKKMGVNWDPQDEQWNQAIKALEAYKDREGHCDAPQSHKEGKVNLGSWLSRQRNDYKNNKLSPKRITQLEMMGVKWDPNGEKWNQGIKALEIYKEREGHCDVPRGYKEGKVNLGSWLSTQRNDYKNGNLSTERIAQLEEMGVDWDPFDEKWNQGIKALETYKEREGHCDVPKSHKEGELNLGAWLSTQRQKYKNNKLSPERITQLKTMGVMWDVLDEQWNQAIKALEIYKEREGHCDVPKSHKEGEVNLGNWLKTRRKEYKNNKLSPERITQLKKMGVNWDPQDEKWNQGIKALEIYKEREGHCDVPQSHKEGEVNLGSWLNKQRQDYNNNKLSPKRITQLEMMGVKWDPNGEKWNQGIKALETYKEREGHCDVPKSHKEGEVNLGNWLNKRRQDYNNNKLSPKRITQLKKMGVKWILQNERHKNIPTLEAPTPASPPTLTDATGAAPESSSTVILPIPDHPTEPKKREEPAVPGAPSDETIDKYIAEIGAQEKSGESSGKIGWEKTETRKFQPKFRAILNRAYGGKCPITDSVGEQVEAAHIHVDGTCEADWRYDNSRGILLDLKLHKAYDFGRLNIDAVTGLMTVVDACRNHPDFKWLMNLADGKTVPIVNINEKSSWPIKQKPLAQRLRATLQAFQPSLFDTPAPAAVQATTISQAAPAANDVSEPASADVDEDEDVDDEMPRERMRG